MSLPGNSNCRSTADPALSAEEKTAILETTLADVIGSNTGLTRLQDKVFFAPPPETWADSDRDGLSDIQEVIAGTLPHDPASLFQVDRVTVEGGGLVRLVWPSVPGRALRRPAFSGNAVTVANGAFVDRQCRTDRGRPGSSTRRWPQRVLSRGHCAVIMAAWAAATCCTAETSCSAVFSCAGSFQRVSPWWLAMTIPWEPNPWRRMAS